MCCGNGSANDVFFSTVADSATPDVKAFLTDGNNADFTVAQWDSCVSTGTDATVSAIPSLPAPFADNSILVFSSLVDVYGSPDTITLP